MEGDARETLLDRLDANARRLDRLLSDLLDLNQFAHGSLEVQRERCRLDELCRAAIDQVELGNHHLQTQLETIEASVAPTKFQQIVVNLLANAVVHTPQETRIDLRLERDVEGAHLIVADDGPGIPSETRAQVFEPFRQGATAPSHRPGTGIGLSLVAAFAHVHDERAWVEEVAGGGAAFHVLVPMEASDDGPPAH